MASDLRDAAEPQVELSLGLRPSLGDAARKPAAAVKSGDGFLSLGLSKESREAAMYDCVVEPTLNVGQRNRRPEMVGACSNPSRALHGVPVVPMKYRRYPDVRYVPVLDGNGGRCMMPCWGEILPSGGANNVVACRPAVDRRYRGRSVGSNAGKGEGVAVRPTVPRRAGSTGSISSGVSVRRSGSLQVASRSSSSGDGRCNVSHIVVKPHSRVSSQVNNQQVNAASTQATEKMVNSNSSVPTSALPKLEGANSVDKSTPIMPCVSTTGDGPNGKTITGILYKYNRSDEVSILCACHAISFSPAEFVRHAGGAETANPMRQIVLVSSS